MGSEMNGVEVVGENGMRWRDVLVDLALVRAIKTREG